MKAKHMKPGDVVRISEHHGCLILATSGYVNIEYTFLDINDSYGGAMSTTIGREVEIEILTGLERKEVIKKVKDDVFRSLHDINHLIDMINLIEAMSQNEDTKQ